VRQKVLGATRNTHETESLLERNIAGCDTLVNLALDDSNVVLSTCEVYMCVWIYICTHKICIYVWIYIYSYIHMYRNEYVDLFQHLRLYLVHASCIYVCMNMYIYVHMYIHIYIYIHMHINGYVDIFRHVRKCAACNITSGLKRHVWMPGPLPMCVCLWMSTCACLRVYIQVHLYVCVSVQVSILVTYKITKMRPVHREVRAVNESHARFICMHARAKMCPKDQHLWQGLNSPAEQSVAHTRRCWKCLIGASGWDGPSATPA